MVAISFKLLLIMETILVMVLILILVLLTFMISFFIFQVTNPTSLSGNFFSLYIIRGIPEFILGFNRNSNQHNVTFH